MHEHKSHIKYLFVKLIVWVSLMVVILALREQLIDYLKYLIGGLMVLYGVEEILFEVIFEGKNFWKAAKIYLGLVELILGTTLLFGNFDINLTCVIWAT